MKKKNKRTIAFIILVRIIKAKLLTLDATRISPGCYRRSFSAGGLEDRPVSAGRNWAPGNSILLLNNFAFNFLEYNIYNINMIIFQYS